MKPSVAPAPCNVRVEATSLVADSDAIFNTETPVSDHLPQTYRLALARVGSSAPAGHTDSADIDVLVWNVMCRGRAGKAGRSGTALEGKALTNNGLDYDESPQAYERRILGRVAPLLGDWWSSDACNMRRPAPRLACLQEFPAQPLLQDEFLTKLREGTRRLGLQLAVHPPVSLGAGDARDEGGPMAGCTAVVWDETDISGCSVLAVKDVAAKGAVGLSLRYSGAPPVALYSVHLPFRDRPGGARYGDAVESARATLGALRSHGAGVGAAAVVVAGDFNVDVRHVASRSLAVDGERFEYGVWADSTAFRGARLTTDACIAAAVSPEAHAEEGKPRLCAPSSPEGPGGVLRAGSAGVFFGVDREEFFQAFVARALQDDPRTWGLGDKALATLGCWPFVDQPVALDHILAGAAKQPPQKRSRLANPLGLQGVDGYESDSSSSESSE
mmetsp:Transcript_70882/g.196933  ORF Transcript_70882/g.196933 Transcript_70882/m.196933 type:complete len:444 (+) Transcript_70882:71-1402(+)